MDYLCEYVACDDVIDIKPHTNIDDNRDTLSSLLTSTIKQESCGDNETSNIKLELVSENTTSNVSCYKCPRWTSIINIEHNYSVNSLPVAQVKLEMDCDSDVEIGLDYKIIDTLCKDHVINFKREDDCVDNENNEVVERLITPEEVFRDLLVTEDIKHKDEQIKQKTGNVILIS